MTSTPHRLQPDTPLADNLALANDNFDKAVQDIGDLGAKFTDSFFVIVDALAAGAYIRQLISISSAGLAQYKEGYLPFVPRLDVWVDTDDDFDKLLYNPFNSLTSGQKNCQVWVTTNRTTVIVLPSDVGTFTWELKNNDSSAHTYYVRGDVWYTQSPRTGNFR